MSIINIAGYYFVSLSNLDELKKLFTEKCQQLNLMGTILLSEEGINISLAGLSENIIEFKAFIKSDSRFAEMTFHESQSSFVPFKELKVKIKKEIITMNIPAIHPEKNRASSITPTEFKQWLDEGRDITILDTRNDYEVKFGTFANAINPNTNSFTEFCKVSQTLDSHKPIVMFCTGGVRCEKAGLYLQQTGFKEVYQLDKGILGYFKEVGGAHYEGECFVFDQRISVDSNLNVSGTQQCKTCQGPIKEISMHSCEK
jgi:UPF0176 protein